MSVQGGLFDGTAGSARLGIADPAAWPVHPAWQPVLDSFWGTPEGQGLLGFLRARLAANATIYPPQPLRALQWLPPDAVRVVILGQDPYHGPGQAEGLAFSVPPGVRLPPSLRNIFKERQRDLGVPMPLDGSLIRWAQQGVLLLNTCLTVEDAQPASHAGRGWELLTDRLIRHIAAGPGAVAFLLWGAHAQQKAALLDGLACEHLVLRANHPSPLSATRGPQPFIGCGHFGEVSRWLRAQGRSEIDW